MRKFTSIAEAIRRALSAPYVAQMACFVLMAFVLVGSIGCEGQVHAGDQKPDGFGIAAVDLALSGVQRYPQNIEPASGTFIGSEARPEGGAVPVLIPRNEYDLAYYDALRKGATLCVCADQSPEVAERYRRLGYVVANVQNDSRFKPGVHFFAKQGNGLVEARESGIVNASHSEPDDEQEETSTAVMQASCSSGRCR